MKYRKRTFVQVGGKVGYRPKTDECIRSQSRNATAIAVFGILCYHQGADESSEAAMYRSLAFALVMLSVPAVSVQAQNSASDADSFCATAPTELLSALEGNWRFSQGAGSARAGMINVPLPAPRPVTLNLEFFPDGGFGFLTGQGQAMIVFPALPGPIAEQMDLMPGAELTTFDNTDGNCDWMSLPSIVGSNDYSLSDGPSVAPAEIYIETLDGGVIEIICAKDSLLEQLLILTPFASLVPGAEDGFCNAPELTEGHMSMTIVARFNSPNSGFGRVLFEGNIEGGARYIANAPITLSR